MIIKTFINPPFGNNNYLIIDEPSHDAVLIDCSAPSPDIIEFLKENKANLKYILITHGHFDHIMGLNYFRDKCPAPVFAPAKDKDIINHMLDYIENTKNTLNSIPNYTPDTKIPVIDNYFDNDISFKIGNNEIKLIPTPGHTSGSVCFLLNDTLFSGDTMFYHSYGRTDLPSGNETEIFKSLDLLLSLPKETVVLPGHGNETTINEELNFYGAKNE